MFSTYAYGVGSKLLGRVCRVRKNHNPISLSEKYGVSISTARRIIRSLSDTEISERRTILPTDVVEPTMQELKRGLRMGQAAEAVGVSHDAMVELEKHGWVKSKRVVPGTHVRIFPEDIQDFRASLYQFSQLVDQPSLGYAPMSELYARLSIGINEICQLIHSRRIVSLQHTAGAHSIQDIHLNLDEVRAFLTQALPKGYDKKELAVILRLNSIGLKFITDQQLIRSEVYRSPFSNQPMAYFFDDAINEFFASYVPLSFLARHRGVQARVAHVELNGLGIRPLDTPRKSGLLYRRNDLPRDWQVSREIWRSPQNLSRLSKLREREISTSHPHRIFAVDVI